MSDYICPYNCSYRTNSGFCGSTGGWERCQYRQLHQPNTVVGYVPSLKKTHADRIRAMTDEELAEFLYSIGQNPVTGNTYLNGKFIFFCGAGNGWLDWLKEEVESNDS